MRVATSVPEKRKTQDVRELKNWKVIFEILGTDGLPRG